ncbi:MAG TPA: DUF4340 domain-containing protein [Myxococcales bacterium]|jgi:hypothetical protein
MAMTQKMRSLLSLLALAAVAGGAGLYAYYGVHLKQEAEKAKKEKDEKLFADLDKTKLAQVTVTAKGETTVLAHSKTPEQWNLISPVNTLADKGTIEALVDRLGQMKSKSVVEEKAADLKKYGLDKPAIKVVAKTEDGKEFVLRCGEENSFDSSIYVALGDSHDVVSAEGSFKNAVERTTFDLRDKRVAPVEESEIAALELTTPDSLHIQLTKQDGKWKLLAPIADRGDDQAVNKLVSAIRNLRAIKFVTDTASADDVARYQLDKPRAEAVLTLTSGARMTLTWQQITQDSKTTTYARRKEATFIAEVPDAIVADLNVKPGDLRDKSLITFDKDKVAKVTFALAEGPFTLERKKPEGDAGKSEDWTITAPTPGVAKKWKMNSVLWGLSSMKATGIAEDNAADLAKYGLDKPAKAVTLFDGEGKELGTVAFGKEEADKVYARNTAETRVFQVEKSRMGELPSARADLEEVKADAGAPK